MQPILIIYATREGQTRHIAEHLAESITRQHCASELAGAAHLPQSFSLDNYSAVIVCASIHVGKHEPEMTKFVKRHLDKLQRIPSAFLSVSLSEAGAENPNASPERQAGAEAHVKRTIRHFLIETGWCPNYIKAVAGALSYSRYNFFTRFVMKRIAANAGMPTDTSRDYEFTDWNRLDHFLRELIENVPVSV
jgi:menaquinone-dependent protoporphyrinogen oxidase